VASIYELLLDDGPAATLALMQLVEAQCGPPARAACAVIGLRPDARTMTLPVLADAVRQATSEVKLDASWALSALVRQWPSLLSSLAGDASPDVCNAALAGLASARSRCGIEAAPELAAMFLEWYGRIPPTLDATARVRACHLAALLLHPADRYALHLRELRHPNLTVRVAAAQVVEPHSTRGAEDLLRTLCAAGPEPSNAFLRRHPRLTASWLRMRPARGPMSSELLGACALGGVLDPAGYSKLAALVQHPFSGVRLASARAIAATFMAAFPDAGDRALVDVVAERLASETDSHVALELTRALACSGGPSAPAVMVGRMARAHGGLRDRLVDALVLFDHLGARRRSEGVP
jgi:hypothetical protein